MLKARREHSKMLSGILEQPNNNRLTAERSL